MMMNDMKKNELNEQEMNGVAGGYSPALLWHQMERERQKQEEARQRARQQEEARRKAENANAPGAHAHDGGASGGW